MRGVVGGGLGGVGNHRDLLTTRTEQVQAREWKWWMST